MSALPPNDRPRPESLTDLYVSFTLLALQGFGGVLAVVQRELVENKRWMTRDEFIEDWSVSQILPGPNVINMALIVGGAVILNLTIEKPMLRFIRPRRTPAPIVPVSALS